MKEKNEADKLIILDKSRRTCISKCLYVYFLMNNLLLFIGGLFANWNVSASDFTIYMYSCVFCFSAILVIHFFIWYKFYSLIRKNFLSKHLTFWKIFRIVGIIILSVYLFWKFWESWYLPNICESFALWMAQHIHLPWHWEPMEINLD